MSWVSPISTDFSFDSISKKLAEEVDEKIYKAVCDVTFNVDKEELIKALRYDRGQYDKGYWDGRNYKPPILTNADRIRAMTDEELAEQLYLLRLDALRIEGYEGFIETKDEVLDWLKEEVEEQ